MRSRSRELQIPPMVYDGARPKAHFLNQTDKGHTPAPCLYEVLHKVVPICGLALGGL